MRTGKGRIGSATRMMEWCPSATLGPWEGSLSRTNFNLSQILIYNVMISHLVWCRNRYVGEDALHNIVNAISILLFGTEHYYRRCQWCIQVADNYQQREICAQFM